MSAQRIRRNAISTADSAIPDGIGISKKSPMQGHFDRSQGKLRCCISHSQNVLKVDAISRRYGPATIRFGGATRR